MSHPYLEMTDAELYDRFRDVGLSPDDAKRHVELRRTERTAIDPEAVPDDPNMGAFASARIGVGQGLGGAGGALLGGAAGSALLPGPGTIIGALIGGLGGQTAMKPLTELLSSAPASDVKRQWDATVGANPKSNLAGNVLGGLIGGTVASRVASIGNKLATTTAERTIKQGTAARQPLMTEIAQQRARNLRLRGNALETATAAPATDEILPGGLRASEVRSSLERQGFTPENIERALSDMRGAPRATTLPVEGEVAAGFPEEPTPTLGQALSRATHAAQPISPGPPGSGAAKLEPIPETGGRGFTAEGPPTPPVPSTPTIAEMQGLAPSRLIGDDPVAQALAKQTVERQIATGARGPQGGALVGTRAVADQSTVELMANRIAKASVEQLQDALNMPGEDWVQAAIRKELARRGP